MVLLKPLADALRDRDIIYGVIKGSAINSGGKTSGYTVPNPIAQAELIKHALDDAQLKSNDINYIEAHGTGTSLGDPIEVAGLMKGMAGVSSCALGSVKSNIGHLESAAGIAGVTKVLLQMKNKKLAPSINAQVLNQHINFANSPFSLVRELTEWTSERKIAGISSFGAGGANAHVIIAEPPGSVPRLKHGINKPCYLITLSAKTQTSLNNSIINLAKWLASNSNVILEAWVLL